MATRGKRKRARCDGKTDDEVLQDLIKIRDEQIQWVMEVQKDRDASAIFSVFGAMEKALDRVHRQRERMGVHDADDMPVFEWLPFEPDPDKAVEA